MIDNQEFIIDNKNYLHKKFIKHINIFKKIHKLFVILLKKHLWNKLCYSFDINIVNYKLQNKLQHKHLHKGFFVELRTLDINTKIFIFFYHASINQLISLLFNHKQYVFSSQNSQAFSSSKIYIINTILDIIIKSYNYIFKEWYFLDSLYFIYKKNVDILLLKKQYDQLYYNTKFICITESFELDFIVYVPCIVHYQQDKYLKYLEFRKSELSNIDYTKILVKHVYNILLNLTIQLNKNSILLNNIIHLKIGDIFYLQHCRLITLYSNNIPILLGEYHCSNNKTSLHITKNFLYNTIYKEENIMKKINKKNTIENFSNILQESKNDLLNVPNDSVNKTDFKKTNLNNSIILDTMIDITIHLGTLQMKISDLIKIVPGKILYLDQFNQDTLDIFVNNVLIAQGELVHLKNKYGIRVTKIINCIN